MSLIMWCFITFCPVFQLFQAWWQVWSLLIYFGHKWSEVKSHSPVWLFATRPHGLQRPRLLHPRDFPGKSTGVGCHFLLPFGHKGNINKSLCFLTPALYFFLVHHKLCEKRFACKTRYLKKLWWNYFLISKSFTYSKEGYVKYIEIF